MTCATELALSKIPMRKALSAGLYQKEKYSRQQGTVCVRTRGTMLYTRYVDIPTPASGIPSMKRAAIRPAAFLQAAMHMTIAPPYMSQYNFDRLRPHGLLTGNHKQR